MLPQRPPSTSLRGAHNDSSSTMFTGSHMVIAGGSFVQTNLVPAAENRGFNLLTDASSPFAFHNAGHQFDLPNNYYSSSQAAVLDRIKGWISDDTVPVMWLDGAAGAGKSSVARSIAVWCERERLLLASFFFSRSDPSRNNGHRFIPTLAYSIVQSIPESRHLIEQAVDSDPHILSRSLDAQISHLILRPLLTVTQNATGHAFPHVLVIDGLDECQDETAQKEIVRLFCSILNSWNLRWKVLITSRPEQAIRMSFADEPTQYLSTRIALSDGFFPESNPSLPDSNSQPGFIHTLRKYIRPRNPKIPKPTSIVPEPTYAPQNFPTRFEGSDIPLARDDLLGTPPPPSARATTQFTTPSVPPSNIRIPITLKNRGDSWITYSYHEGDREHRDTLRGNEISENQTEFLVNIPYCFTLRSGRVSHRVSRTFSMEGDWDIAEYFN